jgi:hypothetical protein
VEAALTAKAERDAALLSATFPGAALRRFGGTVATRHPALPDLASFNRARGFSLHDRGRLDEIRAFYAEAGVSAALEIWEADEGDELRRLLAGAGLAPGARSLALHVSPRPAGAAGVPGVDVVEVGEGEDGAYLGVLLQGYGVAPKQEALRRTFALEHATPGLRRYLALIDGEPAAAGGLLLIGGTGLLAGAATVPRFRGRGGQTALLRRRIADAAGRCEVLGVTAAVDSASHRNLVREGFAAAHLRTIWR